MNINVNTFLNKIINICQQLNIQLLLHVYDKVRMHKKFNVKAKEDTSDIAFEMKEKKYSSKCTISINLSALTNGAPLN